jgi:hypothetical protein
MRGDRVREDLAPCLICHTGSASMRRRRLVSAF